MQLNYTERLVCSAETKRLIIEECRRKMQERVKSLRGLILTQDYILQRIAYSYLDIDPDTMLGSPEEHRP